MGLIKNTTATDSVNPNLGLGTPIVNVLDKPGDIKISYQPMNKDRRILVQGILQAVVQSQGLLLEPGGTWEERVEQATLRFVKFVEEQSR